LKKWEEYEQINIQQPEKSRQLSFVCIYAFSRVRQVIALIGGRQLVVGTIVGAFAAGAIAAVLTPGAGILSAPVFARATFADPTDIKFKIKGHEKEVIHVPEARETVVQQIVVAPGGHTGWHSHPGPVVVLVKSGRLSFYDGDDPTCAARTYSTGEAFVDSGQGHVHIARNESTTDNLEVWPVYFDVPPGGAFRIDVPDPGNCSF
jgi:quercetin dioxygenase-like cupin family protein